MRTKAIQRPAVIERLAAFRRGVLLFIAAGIPLAYLPGLTLDPYNLPKTSLLLIGTALAGVLKVLEIALGGSARGLRRALVPALGLGLPLLIAWLASPYHDWEVWGAYRRLQGLAPSLVVIVFGVLLCDAVRGKGGAKALAWTLASSGGLVGAYAMVQMFGFDPFLDIIPSDYVPSTVGYSNFVGGFLAICLPACMGLWAEGGRARYPAQALTILTAAALVGSFSQGGWGAALAGLAVFAGLSLCARWKASRFLGFLAAAVVAVVMVGPVILSVPQGGTGALGGTIATRGLHWDTALNVFDERPLLGWGPSAYLLEAPRHRSSVESLWLDDSLADDPHSVPLATLVNAGLLGALGYLVAMAWVFTRVRKVRPSPLAAAATGSLTAYLTQSLVSIDVVTLRVSFWVCLAGLIAVGSSSVEARKLSVRWPRESLLRGRVAQVGFGLAALALCLVAGASGVRLLVADHHAQQAKSDVSEGRIGSSVIELEAAMSLSSMGHYRHFLGEQLTTASVDEESQRPKLLKHVRDAYEEIAHIPDLQWIVGHGRQLDQWSTYDPALLDDALRQYERAHRMDPHSVSIGVTMADLQLRLGGHSEARGTLRPYVEPTGDAPDLVRPYPELWGALAIAEWQSGDEVAARAALETGYAMNPDECHVLIARRLLGSDFRADLPSRASIDLSISLACASSTASLAELDGPPSSKANVLSSP